MKLLTLEELKSYVESLYDSDVRVEVTAHGAVVTVEVGAMYEKPPGLTLKQLMALATVLNTYDIRNESGSSNSGCESCDYGSYYSFVLQAHGAHYKK